jgi:hypothetical protein
MYYQAFYPQTEFIMCPSETQGVDRESWFKNDYGIERVLGELARCGNQFVDIVKDLSR